MKNKILTIGTLASSVVATLFLALGLNHAAQKFDPIVQKTVSVTTLEIGEVSANPCIDGVPEGSGSPETV